MPWKSFVRGYGSLGGRNGRASVLGHVRYVQRGGECILSETISFGEVVEDPVRIRARWRDIYDQETGRAPLEGVGNQTPEQRKIGPKGRWDGRVMERLAVPLPNGIFDGLDDEEQRRKIRQLIFRLNLNSTDISWALHEGHRREKEDNLHLHILFRPRDLDGKKHHWTRDSLRAWRTRQLQAITGWVIQQGIDAQVPAPSESVHLGPHKAALHEKGVVLENDGDQRMAQILDLANTTRQMTTAAAKAAWEAAEAGGGLDAIAEAGWRLVREGPRGTWTMTLNAAPRIHFAVRRLIGIREQEVAARVQAMQDRAAAEPIPNTKPIAQIEIARHPRTGEVAVWEPSTGTILVLDSHGDRVRTVYVRRICPGEIDWTAVGRVAIGRRHFGDGDTCGAVALGHDEERLVSFVLGLRGGREIPEGDEFSR